MSANRGDASAASCTYCSELSTSSSYRVCLSTGGCSNFPRGDGTFRLITKPGQGTGAVWNNIGVLLTSFAYSSSVGETAPLGTIGDRTPPVITVATTGTLNAVTNWYTSDVSVAWAVVDGESPITAQTGCGNVTVSVDTPSRTYTCTATSSGGTATKSVTLRRDATAPTITWSGNAGSYTVDQRVAIDCTASDATSGIAVSTCVNTIADAYTFTLGANTLAASATDKAGNSRSDRAAFSVIVTATSVCTLVERWTNQPGISNSLCTKLLKGNHEPFRNEVAAQSGKAISDAHAAILLRLSNAL